MSETPPDRPGGALSLQAMSTGVLAAFVGFASSFAVIIQGLTAVGATPAQVTSGLMALAVFMGLGGIFTSLRTKQPISIAWSTPGAALLATTGQLEGGFAAAVGAFIIAGALVVLSGLWRPLGRAVAAIPAQLASAMLAGVLLNICLAPVQAVAQFPAIGLAIVGAWAVTARLRRLLAVPVAVLVAAVLIALTAHGAAGPPLSLWPAPVLVVPRFTLAALFGVALPLFLVSMASQNVPGLAVLKIHGYDTPPGLLLRITGLLSMIAAPFGAHSITLAAITAAMCASPDAHPDPRRRYGASMVAGGIYVVLGLLAGAVTAFISASPPVLIEAVAGLALLGPFGASMMEAMAETRDREAAVITFLVTASGLTFAGIGGAFWGLLAGGAIKLLARNWR